MKKGFILGLAISGILLACTNEGFSQWVQTNGPYGGDITCLAAVGSEIYAGTSGGGVFRSNNNGTSWTAASTGLALTQMTALGVKGTSIFAGVTGGYQHDGIFLSTDGGMSWVPAGTALQNRNINCIVADDSDIFAGATNGLFLSTDNGMNWSEVMSNQSITALTVFDKSLIVGVGYGIFRTTDDGTSWTEIDSGVKGQLINALAVLGNDLLAGITTPQAVPVGGQYIPEGGIYMSADSGAGWTAVAGGLPNTPVTCLAVKDGDVFAGTSKGVYVSSDNGNSWVQKDDGLANTEVNTFLVNGTSLFAGAVGGVYLSINDGTSWSEVNSGIINTSTSTLADFGTSLFAGDDGILLTTDGGARWSAVDSASPFISAFAKSGSNIFAAMRFFPGVLRSTDNGGSWTLLDSDSKSDYFTSLAAFTNGSGGTDVLAGDAQKGNGVFLSTDNGATWTSENSGLTNPWVYSLAVKTNVDGTTEVFAGTQNGGLFLSTDYGKSWTVQSTDLSNRIVLSLVTMGTRLFAATNGGVYVSTDDGVDWTAAGPPNASTTSLAVSGTNLFAGGEYDAYSNGGVFLSTDYGTNWVTVDSGLTNTDISALAAGETNLYAGTNGSGTWSRPLSEMITSVKTVAGGVPATFSLAQNYPNPFNPTTVIAYDVARRSRVTLTVYDPLGRIVTTLVDGERAPGEYQVTFNASRFASGVYFYRLQAGSYSVTMKMLLLK